MTITTPGVSIKQEFLRSATADEKQLPAIVIGPEYALNRYDVTKERPNTILNNVDGITGDDYVTTEEAFYEYPNRPAGGVADLSYNKLYLENAVAEYLPNSIDALVDLTASRDDNKITSTAATPIVFKNGNGFERSTVLGKHDVAKGDLIELSGNGQTVLTKVKNVLPGVTASSFTVTPSTFNAVGNKASQTETYTVSSISSGLSAIFTGVGGIIVDNTSEYLGDPVRGIIADDWVVTVTTGVTWAASDDKSTVLSGLRFQVTSAKGHFSTISNLAFGAVTGGGTNAATFKVTALSDLFNSVILAFVFDDSVATFAAPGEIVAGSSFKVALNNTITPLTGLAAGLINITGTYDWTSDHTFKIEVLQGGWLSDGTAGTSAALAVLRITSAASPIKAIYVSPYLDNGSAVAVPIGNTGLSIASVDRGSVTSATPDREALIAGDVYYFTAEAAKDSKYVTIETTDDLTVTGLPTTGLTYRLFLNRPSIEVPSNEETNWVADASEITVKPGITVRYKDLVTSSNNYLELPVISGKLRLTSRYLNPANIYEINRVNDIAEVNSGDLIGAVDKDNPLAQGVYFALANANGQPVYYLSVATDDLDGYKAALDKLKDNNTVYSVVPLTFDATIIDEVVTSINLNSTEIYGKWGITWVSAPVDKEIKVYDLQEDGSPWLCTISDDPSVVGNQYRRLVSDGANFLQKDVKPNDKVRLNFRYDSNNALIYDEYTVDLVKSEASLILKESFDSAITIATKFEIVHVYTKQERINNVISKGVDYNNRRVRAIFPEFVKNNNVSYPAYFVCSALAGLRSSVVPHQGLTNTILAGFDDVTEMHREYTTLQLEQLAQAGIWIIAQKPLTSSVYIRRQLTTDTSALNTAEDSVTTNVDAISYELKSLVDKYIGQYNVNTFTQTLIDDEIRRYLDGLVTNRTASSTAGPRLIKYVINEFTVHPTFKDRYLVRITLTVPYPLNNIEITLAVE